MQTGEGLGSRAMDEPGFHEFAAARGTRLFRTAYLMTGGDWHLAEDLTQETLAKLYGSWRRVSRVENPAAYAQTVLARVFVTRQRRRSSSEQPLAEPPEQAAETADPTLRLTLLQELGKLPPRDRAVLVLRYWEDLSVDEVARILDVSPGSVRTQSMRALGRLRAALGDHFPERAAN
jgi:RNA polymerase sigma-70 factor (sigma-E family)